MLGRDPPSVVSPRMMHHRGGQLRNDTSFENIQWWNFLRDLRLFGDCEHVRWRMGRFGDWSQGREPGVEIDIRDFIPSNERRVRVGETSDRSEHGRLGRIVIHAKKYPFLFIVTMVLIFFLPKQFLHLKLLSLKLVNDGLFSKFHTHHTDGD